MVILLGLLLAAAVYDLREGRIPNRLILAGVLLGMLRIAVCRMAFPPYLIGILIPILFLFPFFSIGALGAGDIKLISMIGFFLSPKEVAFSILLAFAMAAAAGVAGYLKDGILIPGLYRFWIYIESCLAEGIILPYPGEKGRHRIHLAPFIFIGTAIIVGGDIG